MEPRDPLLINNYDLFQTKRRVTIRKLDMCKGKESLPLRWSNATVSYNEDTKETVFGLNVKVLREVSRNFSVSNCERWWSEREREACGKVKALDAQIFVRVKLIGLLGG